MEESVKKLRIGGKEFLLLEEMDQFREMLQLPKKVFAFLPNEIGCADPKMIEPMVIFTIDHVLWNLKVIPVLHAHIPKVIDLLKEKVAMGIFQPLEA